jgi:hypothetical protein
VEALDGVYALRHKTRSGILDEHKRFPPLDQGRHTTELGLKQKMTLTNGPARQFVADMQKDYGVLPGGYSAGMYVDPPRSLQSTVRLDTRYRNVSLWHEAADPGCPLSR